MALRILKLKIHGFRNVPSLDLDLNGCNLLCFGDNMVGKSNLITAIYSLLLAKFPPGSINHDMNEAQIEVLLSDFVRGDDPSTWVPIDGTEHKMRAHIYRDKNNEQKVDLELHYPDGGADDKVTPIRSYLAQAERNHFVELARNAEGRAKQLTILRSMFPEELQEKLRQLETRIRLAEKDRLKTGQELASAKGYVKKANITKEQVDKYTMLVPDEQSKEEEKKKLVPGPKIDVVSVTTQRTEAIAHNTKVEGAISRRNERLQKITDIGKAIEKIERGGITILSQQPTQATDFGELNAMIGNTIKQLWDERKPVLEIEMHKDLVTILKSDITQLDEKNVEANQWIQENPVIDLTAFDKQLAQASEHNSMIDKVAEYLKLVKEAEAYEVEYGELDALVGSTRESFTATVRSFDLPVIGMTFDDTQVMYNGKPADEANTSKAERMIIDIMVSIAQLGKAQILFVEECESMGSDIYNEFRDLCDTNGIQCLIEQVERQDKPELRLVVECERPQTPAIEAPANQ